MDVILPIFWLDEELDTIVAPDLAVPHLGIGGEFVHLRFETDDVKDE